MNDAILIALIGLVAVQLGHLVNNFMQSRAAARHAREERKREIYFKYITSFVTLIELFGSENWDRAAFMSASSEVLLIVPDEVVRQMVELRRFVVCEVGRQP